jgi:hypothetical protein
VSKVDLLLPTRCSAPHLRISRPCVGAYSPRDFSDRITYHLVNRLQLAIEGGEPGDC